MGAFEWLLAALASPPRDSDLGMITARCRLPLRQCKTPTSGWGSIADLRAMQQGARS